MGAMPLSCTYYVSSYGLVHMDNVEFTVDKKHLFDCEFIQNHNCWHDASVNCTVAKCTEGAVRLVGGMSYETEDRVEICLGGNWYRVCDRYFLMNVQRCSSSLQTTWVSILRYINDIVFKLL